MAKNPVWKETIQLVYLFWMKPLSLHRLMVETAGPESDGILGTSLLRLATNSSIRRKLLENRDLVRLTSLLMLGNLLLLVIGNVVLVALLDAIGFTAQFGDADVAGYWSRVAGGVAFGVAVGVVVGVAFGVAGGVAGGLAAFVSYTRLFLLPLWLCWTGAQWWLVKQRHGYEKRAFRHSAIALDELIYAPLPLFDRLLWLCMKAVPGQARMMLDATAASTGQTWALPYASSQWVAFDGQNAADLGSLEPVARRCEEAATIIRNNRKSNDRVIKLLQDMAAIASSLAAIDQAQTLDIMRRTLDRNRQELESIATSASQLKHPHLAGTARHWQRLIRDYETGLPATEGVRIRGVYQAGSALASNSALFRGRRPIFAQIQELYADPDRAETLLLIGQQRMGKSSILYQLPVQLPDAHVIIIDSQRFANGHGDATLAAGMTAAIDNWEKRRPGGIRLPPLEPERIGSAPLHHLERWLEQFADRTRRRRRVLLCIDELNKLLQFVSDGHASEDILNLLRGLSQAQGWMVLYSGQYEVDEYEALAEYLKNTWRMRVSYLREDEATDLLTNPVPNFGLHYTPDAVQTALQWTHCHPYFLQQLGSTLANRFELDSSSDTPGEPVILSADAVESAIVEVLDTGRLAFLALYNVLSPAEQQALHQLARSDRTDAQRAILAQLADREHISRKADSSGWQFQMPLFREWILSREDLE